MVRLAAYTREVRRNPDGGRARHRRQSSASPRSARRGRPRQRSAWAIAQLQQMLPRSSWTDRVPSAKPACGRSAGQRPPLSAWHTDPKQGSGGDQHGAAGLRTSDLSGGMNALASDGASGPIICRSRRRGVPQVPATESLSRPGPKRHQRGPKERVPTRAGRQEDRKARASSIAGIASEAADPNSSRGSSTGVTRQTLTTVPSSKCASTVASLFTLAHVVAHEDRASSPRLESPTARRSAAPSLASRSRPRPTDADASEERRLARRGIPTSSP
jgi:hypothetical protein